MPIVKIDMFPGRTGQQKEKLAQRITDAFVEECNAKPESVHVLFTEVAPSDWAVSGTLVSNRQQQPA